MAIVLEEISAYLDNNEEQRWGEKAWVFDDDGNFVNVFPIVRDKDESWANEKIKKYGLFIRYFSQQSMCHAQKLHLDNRGAQREKRGVEFSLDTPFFIPQ